ncbi:unnamed protein product [Durusdinium trenchii]|uniref:FAD-binding FR-type domain-containing protein n=1 Tax=Durusdinium trenchii TaxID=1381693 RepID=A0ABP0J4Z5_9DINO
MPQPPYRHAPPILPKSFSPAELAEIAEGIFRENRWERAIQALEGVSRAQAKDLLQEGAKAYGFWLLPDEALEALVSQLCRDSERPSVGLEQWAGAAYGQPGCSWASEQTPRTRAPMTHAATFATSRFGVALEPSGVEVSRFRKAKTGRRTTQVKPLSQLPDWRGHLVSPNYLRVIKGAIHAVVFLGCAAFTLDLVTNKYPKAIETFSWPILCARLGGLACAVWTAILFLSMSRGALTLASRCLPRRGRSFWFTFLDCHKDLHIAAGQAMVFYSALHILGHSIGTIPGILQSDVNELNQLLGCAQGTSGPNLFYWDLHVLHWPPCPLPASAKPKTFTDALFMTMPGLTGVLLLVLLVLVALTSRQKFRSERFETFWRLHNLVILFWPILLFLHGSQGWSGIGAPLALLVCGLPVLVYLLSRLVRLLRCCLPSPSLVRAVIRGETEEGSLVQLEVARPRCWSWRNTGMYAFICMPEYAPLQWHPFTITSGEDDHTVNFLISGIGDWTQELCRRCCTGRLPRLILDGPFTAPTQTALEKRVLVAVGAGVGVTPFISLLSTLLAELTSGRSHRLVEAHFYWMTRDPTEFIFASRLLRTWLRHEILQAKIFIHLHCTAKEVLQNLPAFLFREAVKRQSQVDRHHFKLHLARWLDSSEVQTPGPQFPWAWAEGGHEDLLWVRCPSFECKGITFKSFTGAGGTSSNDPELLVEPPELLPVVLGRPNFRRDVAAIGKARPDMNVHVYVCGNDGLVHDLQSVCESCARESLARKRTPLQKYVLHYERFG